MHGGNLPLALRASCIDHVKNQIRFRNLLQRCTERGDQGMRKTIDESDRVRHQQFAVVRQPHASDERIEGDKQRI